MDKHCDAHSGCTTQIKTNKENNDKVFEILEKVRTRLPHWATVVMALLTGVMGWLLKGL